MKITKKQILCFVLILSFLLLSLVNFFSINEAQAGDLWQMQEGKDKIGKAFGQAGEDPLDVREVIVNIIKIFLTFVGIIFLVMIILAGYKWMTAAGNQDKIGEAKSQLKAAIIGIIIILAAYVITEFIAEELRKEMFDEVW